MICFQWWVKICCGLFVSSFQVDFLSLQVTIYDNGGVNELKYHTLLYKIWIAVHFRRRFWMHAGSAGGRIYILTDKRSHFLSLHDSSSNELRYVGSLHGNCWGLRRWPFLTWNRILPLVSLGDRVNSFTKNCRVMRLTFGK